MSGASLAGAQFTVTYYDGWYGEEGTYDSVPDGFPSEHKRQWVFETKDDGDGIGYVNLQKPSYKVSGDELYFVTDPTLAVYPLGTYVIQETKAPDGYQLSDKVWVRTVTQNGDFTAVETFNDLDGDEAAAIGAVPLLGQRPLLGGVFSFGPPFVFPPALRCWAYSLESILAKLN